MLIEDINYRLRVMFLAQRIQLFDLLFELVNFLVQVEYLEPECLYFISFEIIYSLKGLIFQPLLDQLRFGGGVHSIRCFLSV